MDWKAEYLSMSKKADTLKDKIGDLKDKIGDFRENKAKIESELVSNVNN